jgi:hypothetical protein
MKMWALVGGIACFAAACGGQVVRLGTSGGGDAMAGNGGQGGSGDATTGTAGQGTPGSSSLCGFAPDAPAASSAPTASGAAVLSRIYHFLDDSSVLPPGAAPPPPTAAWAADQAGSILDNHFVAGTEALGLVRFLTAWLNLPAPDAGFSVADAWSLRLVDPTATLTTLLASPTGVLHRNGILTDPQVLTARPSISGRGKWMKENLWCSPMAEPPASAHDTGPAPGSLAPGITERQWLESVTIIQPCNVCHTLMDPAGDSLEHFDAMGNYRDLDNGSPVDSSGTIHVYNNASSSLAALTFTSINDLVPQLAVSCAVAQCFAKLVMIDAFGVPLVGTLSSANQSTNLPFTQAEVNHVANAFAYSNFSIRALVKAIVGTPSFLR